MKHHQQNFKNFTQNWLGNFFTAITFIYLCTACEDLNQNIGSELLKPGDLVSTNYTDTLTLKTSTVLLDSTSTNFTDKLLVGRYVDPVFGIVTAKSYFQIANVDTLKADKNSVLDSVVLTLGYKYYIGDTNKLMSFTVHRVNEKIGQNSGSLTKRLLEALNSRSNYYNYDELNYDPNPIGKIGPFKPKPVLLKSKKVPTADSSYGQINVKMEAEFGKQLLALAGTKAVKGFVDFKDVVKGLVLVPNVNDNAAIIGFEPNRVSTAFYKPTYLGLFYHTDGKKDTLRTYYFSSFIENAVLNNRFLSVLIQKNGTALAGLTKANDAIGPQGPNGDIFIQSSTGISAKIEIPGLLNLSKNGDITINKVELELTPKDFFNGNKPVGALNLIEVNPANTNRPLRTTTGELASIQAEGAAAAQTAEYNATENKYKFNITTFIQSIISGKKKNNGFYITSTLLEYNVNRLILDKKGIKLKVYYSKSNK